MHARKFSLLIVASSLSLVVGSWALAWWLEPLYGDLTRLGGYAERDFGWNQPIEEFNPLVTSFGEWTRPVDILVIGDSFANLRPPQQWQNHLSARTGWSIHTLDVHRVDVAALVESAMYSATPPKAVIWNVIERDLVEEYGKGAQLCAEAPAAKPLGLAAPTLEQAQREQISRSRSLFDTNPGFARTWLFHNGLRTLLGSEGGQTLRVPLARTDMFSSRRADQLVVYSRDEGKRGWSDADLERVRCAFEAMAVRFQANGRTVFVTAMAPDKSTAYRPWARAPEQLAASHLPRLLGGFRVPDARLDEAVREAVSQGTIDVYLPDDTHWGDAGHKIAADAILKLLESLRTHV